MVEFPFASELCKSEEGPPADGPAELSMGDALLEMEEPPLQVYGAQGLA